MPRWTISRTVIHPSKRDRLDQRPIRLLKVSLWLIVLLWGGGIVAFIVLHILQAKTSQHVTIPDLLAILLVPPLIGILFYLGLWGTTSIGRDTRLQVFGRTVSGFPVPGTEKSIYKGDGEFEYFTDIEFQTRRGVRHRVEVEGRWTERSVHLRYDPFDLSNAVVFPSSRPRRSLVQELWAGVFSCGCLLLCIAILGSSLIILVSFFSIFFIPTAPLHP